MASTALSVYEQPLNERLRTLLRLEFLFAQIESGSRGDSEWHSRQAVAGLVEVLGILSARGDLRAEIIKELERLTSTLARLSQTPEVDQEKLAGVLEQCRDLAEVMRSPRGLPGSRLKEDELLLAVMQRSSIPGGTCSFDLPAFQYWLYQPHEARQQSLEQWTTPLTNLRESCQLILGLLRDSARTATRRTEGGQYQQNLERHGGWQLIRVAVPKEAGYFPEISGNKHFFTVRFMRQPGGAARPTPLTEDVQFRVSLCGL